MFGLCIDYLSKYVKDSLKPWKPFEQFGGQNIYPSNDGTTLQHVEELGIGSLCRRSSCRHGRHCGYVIEN